MKSKIITAAVLLCTLSACTKQPVTPASPPSKTTTHDSATTFVTYTIAKGAHYCDKNTLKAVNFKKLSFVVKFDSSAIYQTQNPGNQNDINKLYGFSDNNMLHHEFSARFGWRWSQQALRLFAYVYNNSSWTEKELGTVDIGKEIDCSIAVDGNVYTFTLNGRSATMPRASTTATGQGYLLYPYFGGDETAPHNINISISEL